MSNVRKRRLTYAGIMILGNALVFLAAHIYFLTENGVMTYFELYLEKIWSFIFPLIAVRFALSLLPYGISNAVCSLLISVGSRAVLFIPFYYEYYVLCEGYTSAEAIILSLVRTLVMLLMTALTLALYFLLSLLVGKLLRAREGSELALGEYLRISDTPSVFDLSCPAVAASGAVALAELLRSLVREVIDTVEVLSSSVSIVTPPELFTIVFAYFLLIALFFLGHYITTRVEKWLSKPDS